MHAPVLLHPWLRLSRPALPDCAHTAYTPILGLTVIALFVLWDLIGL